MKKWLRWQGLVAFLLIVGVVAGFFFFMAGALVERGIEAAGTKAVGARVDVGGVGLSFFPVGMTLKGVRVTHPDRPMENAVEVERAELSLDLGGLVLRKVIVTEMAVEGVRFGTPRKTSGALDGGQPPEKEPVKAEEKGAVLPLLEVPDIQEILSRERLATLEESRKLKDEIRAAGEAFKQEFENLPDKERFEAYRGRVKALKSGRLGWEALLGRAGEIKELATEIRSDTARLKKARADLRERLSQLKVRVRQVSRMPGEDYRRLKSKYELSPQGMGNVSGLVLGPDYSGRVESALTWYVRLKPFLEKKGESGGGAAEKAPPRRGEGVDVVFREKQPLPGYLVKRATASIVIAAGEIRGQINNITNEQDVTGTPITCRFSGERLNGGASVVIDGILNHIHPDRSVDALGVSVMGYELASLDLKERTGLDITLEKGEADMDMDATIRGERIESGIRLGVQRAAFAAPRGEGRVGRAIGAALADIRKFSVDATVSGPIDDYKVDLDSDLDGVVQKAVAGIAREVSNEFSQKLKRAVTEKTQGEVASLDQSLGGLTSLDQELAQRVKLGDGLLKDLL